jgi:hypothetical protein
MSIIETSTLQEFGQRYGPDKTQERPGKGDIEIKIPSGHHAKEGTETHYDDTQNINGNGPVRSTGPPAYSVEAQKTAQAQAKVK